VVVLTLQGDATHTASGAALVAKLLFMEADGHALASNHDQLIAAAGKLYADQVVTFIDIDANDAPAAEVAIVGQIGLLHNSVSGSHDQMALLCKLLDRDDGGKTFTGLQFQDIRDAATL